MILVHLMIRLSEWLESQGMEAMDTPVNFGGNDNFWGLLVEGCTHPAYGMPCNKPYYPDLFEAYGFKPYFTQITKHLDLTVPFPERFWKIAEWVNKEDHPNPADDDGRHPQIPGPGY